MSESAPSSSAEAAACVAIQARRRGVGLEPGRAEAVADLVEPILAAFAGIAAGLTADDDMYEFRRLLRAAAGE